MERAELEVVGSVVKDNNYAKVLDYMKDTDGSCCFIKILGNTQILKSFWLEIAKLANRTQKVADGEDTREIIHTKFGLELRKSNTISHLRLSDSRYSKTETILEYGYSCCTIYKEDIFIDPMMIFVENHSSQEQSKGFARWASKIPLPIPNDPILFEALLQHLMENYEIKLRASEAQQVFAMSFDRGLAKDSYWKIRSFIENYYKKEKRTA